MYRCLYVWGQPVTTLGSCLFFLMAGELVSKLLSYAFFIISLRGLLFFFYILLWSLRFLFIFNSFCFLAQIIYACWKLKIYHFRRRRVKFLWSAFSGKLKPQTLFKKKKRLIKGRVFGHLVKQMWQCYPL